MLTNYAFTLYINRRRTTAVSYVAALALLILSDAEPDMVISSSSSNRWGIHF